MGPRRLNFPVHQLAAELLHHFDLIDLRQGWDDKVSCAGGRSSKIDLLLVSTGLVL